MEITAADADDAVATPGFCSDKAACSGHRCGELGALASLAVLKDLPQNVNFAIKAAVAISFLETNGVKFDNTQRSNPMEPVDIAEHAKRFTVHIECSR